jgi:hypothetical protein
MSNIVPNSIDHLEDDLRTEYHFDYSKAKPNRFAPQVDAMATNPAITIELDPDIAAIFPTSIAVNEALRLLVKLRQTTQEFDAIVGR